MDFRPVSNTIVTVPNWILYPGIGTYNQFLQPGYTQNLFSELIVGGREILFQNPMVANIELTSQTANSLVNIVISDGTNLSLTSRANLLSTLISNSAYIFFQTGQQPAATSNVEVSYIAKGNVSIKDTFKANGSQTTFFLSDDPQQNTQVVFVNGVHQSNTAYRFIPKQYGIVEMLYLLRKHTDRLSGLAKAENVQDIDLEKVVSVGTALNTWANGLDKENANNANVIIYCMSSLFCSDILAEYRTTMDTLIGPEIRSNTPNVQFSFSALSGIVNGLKNVIDSDVLYYNQIEAQLNYATLASFINAIYLDPAGQTLLKYFIGTDKLKQIIGLS